MIIHEVEQKSEKWHELRQGRITGTVLKSILGTPIAREKAFYDILAERLSVESNPDESALDRGVRLENEAIAEYEKRFAVKVQRVGFTERDDNKWIASSPDGLIIDENAKYTRAVEVKCLSSSNHIKAFLEQEIPKEFRPQGIQYFCVNDDLERLDFVFYDSRISEIPMHIITLTRKECEKDIALAITAQNEFLNKVEEALSNIILK